jgi:predicted ATP-dependent endonuclease of OLD family
MFLKNFQLFNYKSYIDSGLLEFTPGINIIVGQNNSGKTALLEAMTLRLDNEPHRSFKTLPQSSSRVEGQSQTQISLIIDKQEFQDILTQMPSQLQLICRADKGDNTLTEENMYYLFQKWLDNPEAVELSLLISAVDDIVVNTSIIKDLNFSVYFIEEQNKKRRSTSITGDALTVSLFHLFRERIYRFYAERTNLESCFSGSNSQLNPNASNLAEVLNILQLPGKKKVFERFNQYVSIIFPQTKWISVRPKPKQEGQSILYTNSSELEVLVWSLEAAENDREDLALPLSKCGTGIGQVLAILYVVLTSQEPRTIMIDEPQSFLHPGAAKKLVGILREKEFNKHQYFIATHSPDIITTANPSNIVKLRYEHYETKAEVMNSKNVKEQRSLLNELGVSLSDVFGAENILWVEGLTEERCFPMILEKVAEKPLRGTQILAIKNTGDLEGKRGHIIFDIYDKLSGGKTLFPPAIGFVLDSEGRVNQDIDDLKRRSQNKVEFLPRRMYENYLIHLEAIVSVINEEDKFREEPLMGTEVQDWLNKKKQERLYLSKGVQREGFSDLEWLCKVDGANLLKDLFAEFSEKRVEFSKTKHSYMLTEWLVEHKPDYLSDLAGFLTTVLDSQ